MNLVSDIPIVQQIIANCKAYNLKHIVISPGSRNAPLTLSFSNDSFFTCYSIVDERCAAFFALGIAQQIKQPVAVVCTSGSALLNYYPAVSEAFYSNIPLVVLSADRPKEFIDIGDGQTIRQEHVFKNHSCFDANLKNRLEYSEVLHAKNETLLQKALQVASIEEGPIHINIPLYEPLYNTTIKNISPSWVNKLEKTEEQVTLDSGFTTLWNTSKRTLILVGVLLPNIIEEKVLEELLLDPSVLIFTETTSNLHHKRIISNIDRLIAELTITEKEALQPELLLTFGGLIVSKKIKFFLREFQPKKHVHISLKTAYNTFGCLEDHYKVNPNSFFKELLKLSEITSADYQPYWINYHNNLEKGHHKYLSEIPYSDLLVFDRIIKAMPQDIHLQLSNSSTIRYTQLFSIPKTVEVFCNRGTSGIDGSTSTAIGASLIQKKPTILITGDLSFFYDSNALWNNYIPENFKIIVINNDGGGIFRILPGDKSATYFETFLETTHSLKASNLANMFNFDYFFGEEINFEKKLNRFLKNKKPSILEIHTPRRINDTILLEYFEKIKI